MLAIDHQICKIHLESSLFSEIQRHSETEFTETRSETQLSDLCVSVFQTATVSLLLSQKR